MPILTYLGQKKAKKGPKCNFWFWDRKYMVGFNCGRGVVTGLWPRSCLGLWFSFSSFILRTFGLGFYLGPKSYRLFLYYGIDSIHCIPVNTYSCGSCLVGDRLNRDLHFGWPWSALVASVALFTPRCSDNVLTDQSEGWSLRPVTQHEGVFVFDTLRTLKCHVTVQFSSVQSNLGLFKEPLWAKMLISDL